MPHFHQILLTSLLLFTTLIQAGTIKLPEKLPELIDTPTNTLGTREDNIGLAPGTTVAAFTIKDHLGNDISWQTLQKQAPLLIIFYRGGWCPYCNQQIHQLSMAWPEFKKRGITPVLISADKPDAAAKASRTYEIPFPVLSDPDLIAHNIFQVTMKLDEKMIPIYKKYGITLEDWSGKSHHQFAVASAFIINKKGVVTWAHSSKDYKTRPNVKQLLQAVDAKQDKL